MLRLDAWQMADGRKVILGFIRGLGHGAVIQRIFQEAADQLIAAVAGLIRQIADAVYGGIPYANRKRPVPIIAANLFRADDQLIIAHC